MESASPAAVERPSSPSAAPRAARRPRWGRIALGACIVGAFLLGGWLFLRSILPGSTVVVRNVGDRPLVGMVVLLVGEGSAHVREEWPVGALRPWEVQELDLGFAPDTNLAIRIRTAEGKVLEDRVKIHLGSPTKQAIRVDVAADGVRAAHVRRNGEGEEEVRVLRGLDTR